MAEESSTFKWLATTLIALLAAGGGIVALLQYMGQSKNDNRNLANEPSNTHPSSPNKSNDGADSRPSTNNPNSSDSVGCTIEGKVFDADKKPMSNVDVLLIDGKDKETLRTTSGNDGVFEADCSQISKEHFPQKLQVKGDVWYWDYKSIIPRTGQKGINVYVPKDVLDKAIMDRFRRTVIKVR